MYGPKIDLLKMPGVYRLGDLKRFKDSLKVGKTYELIKITTSAEAGNKRKIRSVRYMRLIAKYPHIALMEDENGFKTSFGYWELSKLLKGEEYI